jgi:hypothetical protein
LYKQSDIRDYEIRELFFIIYKKALRDGLTRKRARIEAYNAIELRYCISSSRARIIINSSYRDVRGYFPSMFVERNLELLELMKLVINEQDRDNKRESTET